MFLSGVPFCTFNFFFFSVSVNVDRIGSYWNWSFNFGRILFVSASLSTVSSLAFRLTLLPTFLICQQTIVVTYETRVDINRFVVETLLFRFSGSLPRMLMILAIVTCPFTWRLRVWAIRLLWRPWLPNISLNFSRFLMLKDSCWCIKLVLNLFFSVSASKRDMIPPLRFAGNIARISSAWPYVSEIKKTLLNVPNIPCPEENGYATLLSTTVVF